MSSGMSSGVSAGLSAGMNFEGRAQRLAPFFEQLQAMPAVRWQGRVIQVLGQVVESQGPVCAVGECCWLVDANGRAQAGEIVGFREATVLSVPLEGSTGVRRGDRVMAWGAKPSVHVGEGWVGRVVDASGAALDGWGSCGGTHIRRLDAPPPLPLQRTAIRTAIGCGIRAVDGLLTCGRGQRLGIFGGSGRAR